MSKRATMREREAPQKPSRIRNGFQAVLFPLWGSRARTFLLTQQTFPLSSPSWLPSLPPYTQSSPSSFRFAFLGGLSRREDFKGPTVPIFRAFRLVCSHIRARSLFWVKLKSRVCEYIPHSARSRKGACLALHSRDYFVEKKLAFPPLDGWRKSGQVQLTCWVISQVFGGMCGDCCDS